MTIDNHTEAHKPKVLIIEDEASWQRELGRILEEENFLVDLAANADEAFVRLKTNSYDLATIDPGLLGETRIAWKSIAYRICRKYPATKIFIVTGKPSLETAMYAINYCAVAGYFYKDDFNTNLFQEKIREIRSKPFPNSQKVDTDARNVPSEQHALELIADSLSNFGTCAQALSNWDDGTEKAVQDVAYVMLRSQYKTVRREVTVAPGPKRAFRCDLLVEDVNVIVEVKRIRSPDHARSIQAELNDDIAGYLGSEREYQIVFLIWDRERHMADRVLFLDAFERRNPYVRVVFAP
jgi:ActR/RegA family two-component response regulator